MKLLTRLLCLMLAGPLACAHADDLWQINSITSTPGGPPLAHSESECMPKDGMDPSRAVPGMDSCRFLQKSGTATAMNFVLECKLPGMPPELAAIRTSGDAHLVGDHFDMRYTIDMGSGSGLPGSELTMTGSVEAHKTGTCNSR